MRRIKQKKLIELINVIDRGMEDVSCSSGPSEIMQNVINEYLTAFKTVEGAVLADFSENKQFNIPMDEHGICRIV